MEDIPQPCKHGRDDSDALSELSEPPADLRPHKRRHAPAVVELLSSDSDPFASDSDESDAMEVDDEECEFRGEVSTSGTVQCSCDGGYCGAATVNLLVDTIEKGESTHITGAKLGWGSKVLSDSRFCVSMQSCVINNSSMPIHGEAATWMVRAIVQQMQSDAFDVRNMKTAIPEKYPMCADSSRMGGLVHDQSMMSVWLGLVALVHSESITCGHPVKFGR